MKLAIVTTILCSATMVAFAEPPAESVSRTPERTGPRHDIAIQLATLERTGVGILAERDLDTRRLSAVIAVGARSAAGGDFDSATVGVGAELRRWFRKPMTGWYLGARTDLSRTRVEDMVESRELGKLTTWSAGGTLGYRWNIRRGLEVTPSLGYGVVVEGGLGGRSPTTARGAATLGLAAGWLF
jgi:hypothetical protein